MLRIVPDPGVLIAALISKSGAPAELLRRWVRGEFQFVVSPLLLKEFIDVTQRPRFRTYFATSDAREFAELLRLGGEEFIDSRTDLKAPTDAKDLYLVDLVVSCAAFAVVTGDAELRNHDARSFQALTPRELVELLDRLDADRL